MTPLAAILWAKRRITRHWIASARHESKLKVGFVSLSAILLWLLAFGAARLFFYLFNKFGVDMLGTEGGVNLTDLVLNRLLSVMALTFFVLLIVSNVLVAFATLYRSREVDFLVQSPITTTTLFLGRFYECVTFSSWALAFLGSPLLLAYGIARSVSPLFYVALVVFYVPFVTLPAAIGTTISIVLVRIFANLRRGAGVAFGLIAVLLLFGLFRSRTGAPDLDQAATVAAVIDTMGQTQSPLLPSYWLSQGLLQAAAGEWSKTVFYWMLLVANALVGVWLATLAAELWYYSGWTSLKSADAGRSATGVRGPLNLLEPLLRPLRQPHRALVVKDLKLFWRDPAQWSQFMIFFGLMALYVANIRNTGGMFSEEPWRGYIAVLNMTASMLILATLTTRFIFPLISLEGRRFWILGLAPVTRRRLVWQKFWLSVGTTSVFTVGLAVLSGVRLRLTTLEMSLSLFSIAATTLALSGLAVGLGSLFPNFQEDNPSRITSGMGGTLNFILSLAYIVLVTAAQTTILQWRRLDSTADERTNALYLILALVCLLTALTTFVPMVLGVRNLERVEI